MIEAVYVLRVKLDGSYDGPIIEEGQLMVSALNIINSGEDEVPVIGVFCERVDSAPVKAGQTDGEMAARARSLLDNIPADSGDAETDEAYAEGYRDALHGVLGQEDE